MSHAAGRRASCLTTIHILWFHFEILSEARGVTDGGVGSGALLGRFFFRCIPELRTDRYIFFQNIHRKEDRNANLPRRVDHLDTRDRGKQPLAVWLSYFE